MNTPFGFIDAIQVNGVQVRVVGWAVDAKLQNVAQVQVLIDGRVAGPAALGRTTPGIGSGAAGFEYLSGFLKPGPHMLAASAIATDGSVGALALSQGVKAVVSVAQPAGQQQLLPRLDEAAPAYSAVGSDFQGLVAQTLGNFGTGNDGFDAVMAVPAGAVDADHAAISELDTAIAAADFSEGALALETVAPLFAEVAAFTAEGDGIMSGLSSLLGI